MKTQRELNLKYWNEIHPMVEAYNKDQKTDIHPCQCVRLNIEGHLVYFSGVPNFNSSTGFYEFAVAILYDEKAKQHRPIFENDRLYLFGEVAIAEEFGVRSLESINYFGYGAECFESNVSWSKPKKRTFEINGFQLTEKEFDWLIYLLKDQPRGIDMATTILKKLDEKNSHAPQS